MKCMHACMYVLCVAIYLACGIELILSGFERATNNLCGCSTWQ